MTTGKLIERRAVFHIGGYDGLAPAQAHRRFVREFCRFKQTWSLAGEVSPFEFNDDQARWSVTTASAEWTVATRFHWIRWDDVIRASLDEPMWRWAPAGLKAFGDFVRHGALSNYFRTNWRYALFFLYPFFLFAWIVGISGFAAFKFGLLTQSASVAVAGGILVFTILVWLSAKFLYLHHLFEDWIFASRYIHSGDAKLASRIERTAERVIAAARSEDVDEVLIIGHSLGAVLAIDLIDAILRRDLASKGVRAKLVMITVGSSILKIGLHSEASRFRAAVQRVAASHLFFWVDYQARIDMMNFFRTEPLQAMGLSQNDGPLVRLVRIRRMLEPSSYRRICRNLFRIHCQFVSGNERRYSYDYNMFVCGPFSARDIALTDEGAVGLLDRKQPLDATVLPSSA